MSKSDGATILNLSVLSSILLGLLSFVGLEHDPAVVVVQKSEGSTGNEKARPIKNHFELRTRISNALLAPRARNSAQCRAILRIALPNHSCNPNLLLVISTVQYGKIHG